MRGIATILLVAGIALMAASWVFPIIGRRQTWSAEQAASYSQARSDLHRLTYEAARAHDLEKAGASQGNSQTPLAEMELSKSVVGGTPIDPASASADRINAELASAKERYQRDRAALDNARSHGGGAAAVLRWVGLALAAIGLVGTALTYSIRTV